VSIAYEAAPHPAFGHLLPAAGEKGIDFHTRSFQICTFRVASQSMSESRVNFHTRSFQTCDFRVAAQSMSLAPRSGERVAEGRVRGCS
jgi:hypothetical protein